MGGSRASLLQRGIDEAAHGADAARDRPGDLRRDCVSRNRCGRLWKPFCGFKAAVGGALPSTAAAASTPWSNSGKAVRDLHHLTGHYPDEYRLLTIVYT